jgi:hypothetical protein
MMPSCSPPPGQRVKPLQGGFCFFFFIIIALVRWGAWLRICRCCEAMQSATCPSPWRGHLGPGGQLIPVQEATQPTSPRLGLAGRRGEAGNSPIVQIHSTGWGPAANLPPGALRWESLGSGGDCWGRLSLEGSTALVRQLGSRGWVVVCLSWEGSPRRKSRGWRGTPGLSRSR